MNNLTTKNLPRNNVAFSLAVLAWIAGLALAIYGIVNAVSDWFH